MKYKLFVTILIAFLIVGFFVYFKNKKENPPLVYVDDLFNVSFEPISFFDGVKINSINYNCPEDDNYKTVEDLSIYDREIRWNNYTLPESQSFMGKGIRFKYLDVDDGKICGNDILKKLSSKEIVGEIFSSVKLDTIQFGDFYGVYNKNASRLNTGYIRQYTLFGEDKNKRPFVMQAYISFIPYADSKELKEMTEVYNEDINEYIENGQTSLIIREKMDSFKKVIMSISKVF